MQKIKFLILTVLFGLSTCNIGFSADASSDQALKQLQLLQQRLMKAENKDKPKSTQDANEADKAKTNENKGQQNQSRQQNKTVSRDQGSQATEEIPGLSEEQEIKHIAFDKVTDKLFPLDYEQTLRLHHKYNNQQYALSATPGTPPKPVATSQFVNLSPGSTPPVIRLAQGFVSSVVFLDSSGAPWPIEAYDLGDPASFNIQWDKRGNTLMIQSVKLYTYGNMAIRLAGLNTPVMLTLVPGQKAVDYRVDMRVQGYGPNAKQMPMGEGLPAHADNQLLGILEGVAPAGSQQLLVKGGPAKAWLLGEKMYVRTNLNIISPGWISTMTSADGMHAYEMQKAPVLLVSWHGKLMQLHLEGL